MFRTKCDKNWTKTEIEGRCVAKKVRRMAGKLCSSLFSSGESTFDPLLEPLAAAAATRCSCLLALLPILGALYQEILAVGDFYLTAQKTHNKSPGSNFFLNLHHQKKIALIRTVKSKGVIPLTCWAFKLILKVLNLSFTISSTTSNCPSLQAIWNWVFHYVRLIDVVWLLDTLE